MPSMVERLSVVETRVENLNEKIDDVKTTLKETKEHIEKSDDELKAQLKTMYDASCTQHAQLAKQIGEIERFKNKWIWMITGGSVVLAFLFANIDKVLAHIK